MVVPAQLLPSPCGKSKNTTLQLQMQDKLMNMPLIDELFALPRLWIWAGKKNTPIPSPVDSVEVRFESWSSLALKCCLVKICVLVEGVSFQRPVGLLPWLAERVASAFKEYWFVTLCSHLFYWETLWFLVGFSGTVWCGKMDSASILVTFDLPTLLQVRIQTHDSLPRAPNISLRQTKAWDKSFLH